MYTCENCNKEFSKGLDLNSKRFCCQHCRRSWIGKIAAKRSKENGTFYTPFRDEKARKKFNYSNSKTKRAPYGTWKCLHCDYIAETRAKLTLHKKEQHPKIFGKSCWNKGLTAETHPSVKRGAIKLKTRYASGEIVGSQKGKPHTQEEKDKIRIGTIRYFLTNNVPFSPRVSVKGCKYMDKLNEANNWNLQHGMNGGEISIDGFFLDGYDKELNIVFEYDEPYHYINVDENILKEKDIYRMNCIHEKLNCRFFRYNEKLDLFYEVKF